MVQNIKKAGGSGDFLLGRGSRLPGNRGSSPQFAEVMGYIPKGKFIIAREQHL